MKALRYVLMVILAATAVCAVAYLVALPEAIAPLVNPLLMMAMPAALGVYIARRYQQSWRLYGLGALTFIGSQLLHIPFNQWALVPALANRGFMVTSTGVNLLVFSLAVGLSSGLFEESARYLVYQRWLPEARSWRQGLMFGAGHGGAEAIILGALVLASFLQALTYYNADLSGLIPADQLQSAQAQLTAYWATPWYLHLLPALERLVTLIFHLSASLLVLQAFRRQRIWWYFAAIGWHTLANAVAVFSAQTWGILASEGLLVIFGLASLGLIYALRDDDQPEPATFQSATPPPAAVPAEPELGAQALEDSRYD